VKYTRNPADGVAITVADVRAFLVELDAAGVPDTAVLRAAGVLEFDLVHGPRIARLTADPDPAAPPVNPFAPPNRGARRGNPGHGPRPRR
jgi:hypothetical protein